MARYLIESDHTEAECLRTLDEISAKGSDTLKNFQFGCGAGTHTGWAMLDRDSERQARDVVPEFLRARAKVVSLNSYTPEQIRGLHAK